MKEIVIKTLALTSLSEEELESLVEVPKEKERGDYAFPCFALAKSMKKHPVAIAHDLVRDMVLPKEIAKVEAVGPYVNFFMNSSLLAEKTIARILKEKEKYGSSREAAGKKFMIEFSQPNTHKAFHIGHIRGTSFGESLARLREFIGYKVIRANYSGDTGMHIAKWLWAYKAFHSEEKIRTDESWFAKIYIEAVQKLVDNEAWQEQVAALNRALDARSDKELVTLWKKTREHSIAAWKPIYKDLDVTFDVHFFESEVEAAGKKIAQDLVKKGIATISDDATIMNFEKENLGVWVLLRRDGTVLYSAKDLALADIKFKTYHADESLVITSVEQNLHFKQLRKTLEQMRFPHWQNYHHLGYESVRLPEGKMSSRTGQNILYADFKEELIQEARKEIAQREQLGEKEISERALAIAIAALKYTMLKQDSNKVIIFDKEEALRFEGDTGPYLLYSYARAQSILRKSSVRAKKSEIPVLESGERYLVNELGRFPEVVQSAAIHNEPSALAHYTYDLAKTFNEFYHSTKVIGSEHEAFRISLVRAFAQTMKNALSLLGIRILKEM